ncbi:hypothetical protein DVR12_03620 [Chitinophaga silvatica]|uniref:Lantibiotic dehydratase N-terminal domain-containing protein n=1 Tax=Chitinophaga silvatica TaxID=2282649 RepID=A0A3E1YHR7_9BACT|nr:lantibiotic dehydratase [Chitinophaga silvatica]RFS26884.1 hypothetical protein DVR12_03620 [Chitinophaga silvatica]
MKIFPLSMVRIGGLTYDKVADLECNKIYNIVLEICYSLSLLPQMKNTICDELFIQITQINELERNSLINIKRKIYNDKPLTEKEVTILNNLPSPPLKERLTKYLNLKHKVNSLIELGKSEFSDEYNKIQKKFSAIIKDENFVSGLLLASWDLLTEAGKVYNSNQRSSKESKTEYALAKYFVRSATKTTPFSAFTKVGFAKNTSLNGIPITIDNNCVDNSPASQIRLNNYLYQHLLNILLSYEPFYNKLFVRLNPTITKETNTYKFLINSNNSEAFQHINRSEVIEYIVDQVNQKPIQYFEIYNDLLGTIGNEQELQITSFLLELFEYGLLEFHIPIAGTDPNWSHKLIILLDNYRENQPIQALKSTLIEIKEILDQYIQADVQTRGDIIKKAYKLFMDSYLALHEAAGLNKEERNLMSDFLANAKLDVDKLNSIKKEKVDEDTVKFKHTKNTLLLIKKESFIYEDCKFSLPTQIDETFVKNTIEVANQLNNICAIWDYSYERRESIKKFYLENFSDKKSIDILTFYEKYQIHQKQDKKKENLLEKLYEQYITYSDALKNSISEHHLNSDHSIDISSEFLLDAYKRTTEKDILPESKSSISCFIQPIISYDPTIASKALISSGIVHGYGKFMSRFLHLFEQEAITDILRDWNTAHAGEDIYLENTDASYFTANVHPTLLNYEIQVPGGHNILEADKQISVTGLSVKYDKDLDELILFHTILNKRVYVHDLGFQAHLGRSPLFRLLDLFSTKPPSPIYIIHDTVNGFYDKRFKEQNVNYSEHIILHPRISIDNKIIIQRKTWKIKLQALPILTGLSTDWEIYQTIIQWKYKNNLPDEVFVRINKIQAGSNDEIDLKIIQKRDDYKPQYINFKSPILVMVLTKLLTRVSDELIVEEMLPSSEHLVKVNEEKYVSEFLFQWYN